MKSTKELKPYSDKEIKELTEIAALPSSERKKAFDKFCKVNNRPFRGAYQKMVKLRAKFNTATKTTIKKRKYTQKSSTIATVIPKTDEPSMSGRTVEIKGIKSISFINNSLLFRF